MITSLLDYKEGTMQVRPWERRSKEFGAFPGRKFAFFLCKSIPCGKEFSRVGKRVWIQKWERGKVESKLPAARPVCKHVRYVTDSVTLGRHWERFGRRKVNVKNYRLSTEPYCRYSRSIVNTWVAHGNTMLHQHGARLVSKSLRNVLRNGCIVHNS